MTYRIRPQWLGIAAAACLLAAPMAQAETSMGVSSAKEAKAMYDHDTQACRSGSLAEDRKTCMLEAKRAYQDAMKEVGGSKSAKSKKNAKKSTS